LITTLIFLFFRTEPIIVQMRTFILSDDLRGVLKANFLPVIWGLCLPLDGGYGSELVIKDHVELVGNASGVQVQYLRHLTGVLKTEAHKDSSSGSWLPSRQLAALLDLGIEDVYRASPEMHVHEEILRNCAIREHIQGIKSILWVRVVYVRGVYDCHGPYTHIYAILPVHVCM
jgi:hypothetical protein